MSDEAKNPADLAAPRIKELETALRNALQAWETVWPMAHNYARETANLDLLPRYDDAVRLIEKARGAGKK